ncbi:hypothetical protein K9U33_04545 [Rhodoblastus acidophilus]|uniref:hypothetical protein n=1 Tax=Candidatus Rhodoblastus alkanivorans TaxID=2954117 RepID=UPI001FA978A7|nr:hypothetical protein [Candidatus Rhodoblastus alkanivorans]MCI4677924.1 hypothetical protein [Candidatus Rhodoblastus alkanivorans]
MDANVNAAFQLMQRHPELHGGKQRVRFGFAAAGQVDSRVIPRLVDRERTRV